MATIIVEDGTGLANSNSYVTEAELIAYAADRGLTLTGTAAILLIQAMDYIEGLSYQGNKANADQSLQWPRYNVVIDYFYIPSVTIPQLLKDALMETALKIDGGNNPLANVPRETIREKVGDIEVEYSKTAMNQAYLAAVSNKLQKLLNASSLTRSVRV